MSVPRDLIGVPYANRGRAITGADCYGIVQLFHRHELGRILPDYLGLYRSADDEAQAALAIALGRKSWTAITDPDDYRRGDVAIFRLMGFASHCGVIVRGWDFLHTLRGRASCIENLGDIAWRHRLEGVMRWTE